MNKVLVFGNVTLDVICQTIDEVPRYESISFDQVALSPGGCASNVAIGLGALGIPTLLVCKTGDDPAADILFSKWRKFHLDVTQVKKETEHHTAVSIGLVDHNAQPRFIHTPGANAALSFSDLDFNIFRQHDIGFFHIGGFFVLPGLLDEKLPNALSQIRQFGVAISLDVVNTQRYWKPEFLFASLPQIDYFLCNQTEAQKLTHEEDVKTSAQIFRKAGALNIIIKLGGNGCYLDSPEFKGIIPALKVPVVDTTGAGDAFAAGLLASLAQGESLYEACNQANQTGASIVQHLGAITYWENQASKK